MVKRATNRIRQVKNQQVQESRCKQVHLLFIHIKMNKYNIPVR